MAKRHTRNRRHKKKITRTRRMVGGAYSQSEKEQLINHGFAEDQINTLQEMNISFNNIITKVNQLMNNGPDVLTETDKRTIVEQIMIELLNENIFDSIPPANNDDHSFNNLDLSMDQSHGSLHLSDLDNSRDSMDVDTSIADESQGTMTSFSENPSFLNETGGKKRRKKTNRKVRKGTKSRKQKGGTCFGNGVGANSFDPNFSIYNTRQLQLFPYKTY